MDTTSATGAEGAPAIEGAEGAPAIEGLKTWSTELEQVAHELASRPLGTPRDPARLVEAIARDVAQRRRERRSGEALRFRLAETASVP